MDFEQIGRDHLPLGAALAAANCCGGPSDRCRARAVGAEPIGFGVGIALFDRDVFRWNADLACQDLSEGRGVPLALADRSEPRDRTPRRVYPDLARIEHAEAKDVAILHRAGADDLSEETDANAHQFARLAAGEGFAVAALLVAQTRVVDRGEGLVEC